MSAALSLGPLDGYRPSPGRYDELLTADGTVRSHWQSLVDSFETLGTGALLDRAVRTRRQLARDGVSYNLASRRHNQSPDRGRGLNGDGDGDRADIDQAGGHPPSRDRDVPWPLDPVPVLVPDAQWEIIAKGVAQRAELLNLILVDLYGQRRLMGTGLLPPQLVLDDPQYVRALHGVPGSGPKELVLVGVDFGRSADGSWRVFGHRTQTPSGAAYALEDRRVLSRVMPSEMERADVQRLAPFLRLYRQALRAAAPAGVDDPVLVLLSSGPRSETAFEHTSLAAQLGIALVRGADLEVQSDGVYLQTVNGPTPVDVILRRLDATYCDPLELDPASTLGVPGLVEAVRQRKVTVVNGLGAPVLENAGLNALLPTLCRRILGEDLILASARAWWCGDPSGRTEVMSRFDDLVIRPVSRAGLEKSVHTRELSRAQRTELAARIAASPERFVGQERIEPGSAPCLTDEGLRPRATVLRTFAVADGDSYFVMPGGLARSARREGDERAISNRSGALSKDIWVCGGSRELERGFWLTADRREVIARREAPSARVVENLFWLGRYAERSEATARLLRVVRDRRREFITSRSGPGPVAVVALLEGLRRTTGTFTIPDDVAGPGSADPDAVNLGSVQLSAALNAIVGDNNNPGSLAHGLLSLLDDVDELQDQLSVDTKLVLADLAQRARDLDHRAELADEAIDELLTDTIQGLLSLAGLVAESLIRDEIWYFIDAGRRLERAAQLTGLLAATLTRERTAAADSLVIESVLTVTESIITYRRRYRSQASVASVLDLLVGDGGNPRSLRYQVDQLTADLHRLEDEEGAPMMTETLSAVGEISTSLTLFGAQLSSIGTGLDDRGYRPGLEAFLDDTTSRLSTIATLISATYFARHQPAHAVVTPVDVSRIEGRLDPGRSQGPR